MSVLSGLGLDGLVQHVDEPVPCASTCKPEHNATVRLTVTCSGGHVDRVPLCDPHAGKVLRVFDQSFILHTPEGRRCGARVVAVDVVALSP